MTKAVLQFRREAFGFFIDLVGGGVVGINRQNGEILLDEGNGEDCYHGAIISAEEFGYFSIEVADGDHYSIDLHFGGDDIHSLGRVPDLAEARKWAHDAEQVIRAHKRTPGPAEKSGQMEDFTPPHGRKLFVGNLSSSATEKDLYALFTTIGPVDEVSLVLNPRNGKAKGFGFVTMTEKRDAEHAVLRFNGRNVDGRLLSVNAIHFEDALPGDPNRLSGGGHR